MDREVQGVWLRGETPQELVLSDGSRLRLEPAEEGRVQWRHFDELRERERSVSVGDAEQLAGDYADYVEVRTRAETEWLRAISDWCTTEADRLRFRAG
jgi:hypothetical protein